MIFSVTVSVKKQSKYKPKLVISVLAGIYIVKENGC